MLVQAVLLLTIISGSPGWRLARPDKLAPPDVRPEAGWMVAREPVQLSGRDAQPTTPASP
jgi:hypothetical protein